MILEELSPNISGVQENCRLSLLNIDFDDQNLCFLDYFMNLIDFEDTIIPIGIVRASSIGYDNQLPFIVCNPKRNTIINVKILKLID